MNLLQSDFVMEKSVAKVVIPYVPCSMMKPCELGSVSKSLEAAMKSLQALRKEHDGDVHKNRATSSHETPLEPKPPDLCQGEHHLLHEPSKFSYALNDQGKTPLLPTFNGENSRAFVSWLFDVECYFENNFFSDGKKFELVVSCLKGSALLWYNGLNLSRAMEGKGMISSWFKLERNMRQKYLPCSTMNELWAELKTLRQNSLSVIEYANLFEELHFVCDKGVNSVQKGIRFYHGLKSEIAKRIDLEMMYSYGELFDLALCVEKSLARPKYHEVLAKRDSLEAIKTVGNEKCLGQRLVVSCLDDAYLESKWIKPKAMDVCDEMNGTCTAVVKDQCFKVKPTFNSTFEPMNQKEKQACTNLNLFHGVRNGQVAEVNSLGLSLNKKLQQSLILKMDQFLISFEDEMHWVSRKGEARGGSRYISCSRAQNLIYSINHCPGFMNGCLRGLICVLSTPHFHFYMLLKLQVSLVHLGAISNILEVRNGGMNQLKSYYPILKMLYFEVSMVQNHCKNLSGLFGISSASSLHGLEGVLANLVMFMMRQMHKSNSSHLIASSCHTSANCHSSLSLNAYMMLAIACHGVVDKMKLKPPWPLEEEYINPLEKEMGMRSGGGSEPSMSVPISSLSLHLLVWLERTAPITPRQATMWVRSGYVILIYDPGGEHMNLPLEVVFRLKKNLNLLKLHGDATSKSRIYVISIKTETSDEWLIFTHSNLRSNFFNKGKFEAGA